MKKCHLLFLLIGALEGNAAPFENLDFEQAITNSLTYDRRLNGLVGSVQDLLRGWQLFQGTNLLTSVGYNLDLLSFFGYQAGSIVGGESGRSIQGSYSLSLYIPGRGGTIVEPFYLSQRGDIPADAKFLAFTYRDLPFAVSINGTQVTPFGIPGGFTSPRTFFVDISRFAGQEVELGFTTIGTPTSGATGSHDLDAIAFLVPEPSAWALLSLGGGALLWFRTQPRLRRSRS